MSSKNYSTFKLGIILAAYAVVSCTILAVVNSLTSPVIAQNQINKANQSMKVVFPDADDFTQVADYLPSTDSSITIQNMYLAKNAGNVIGAVTQVEGPTYDRGTIIVGVDLNGTVTGLQFLKLSDSPGFGLKANDPTYRLSSGLTFYDQFKGLKVEDGFKANGTFDAITGATITSNGVASLVTQGTYSAVKYLEQFGGSSVASEAPEAGESQQIFSFEDAVKDILQITDDNDIDFAWWDNAYFEKHGSIVRNMQIIHVVEVAGKAPTDLIGYAAEVRGQTYGDDGGAVTVLIDKEGTILGARITELNDSPAYGMNTAKPSFYNQFTGRNAKDDILAGSYDAVSGASISSDCIADMVKVASYVALSIKDETADSSFTLNQHYLEE